MTTFEVVLGLTDDNQEFSKVTEAVSYLRSAGHWSIALWLARYLSFHFKVITPLSLKG